MKQVFLIASIIFIVQNSNAQINGGQYRGASGVGGNFEIQNNDGRMIPIGVQEDTKGSPLLLEQWVKGTVLLKNGVRFNDTALNYSLYEDKLYFRRLNRFYIVEGAISEFYLANSNEPTDSSLLHFVAGYPATKITNGTHFFQILADGSRYQLLKWAHKKIREEYTYGGRTETAYVNQEAYCVFEKNSRKMFEVSNKPNVTAIKNTLSIDESIWKAYLQNKLGSNKTEAAMIEFINYLNK
jgi:hypothetical protein